MTAAEVVPVRSLDGTEELEAVCVLFEQIWGLKPGRGLLNIELLRAMVKAGSYVSGAFVDGDLVGASAGFFAAPHERALHSHITGVASQARGRQVGFALKLHQREWALDRGIEEIFWTFDPLVRRNAWFNVAKLGARPVEYLPNFYGAMDDGLNGSDDTDRALVSWRLRDPDVMRVMSGAAANVYAPGDVDAVLDVLPDGGPIARTSPAARVRVTVPPDIEALRISEPATATRWRHAVRDVLGGLLAEGATVCGFDHSGGYLLDRGER
ncbi:MAG: GNAT family N-acetyltransferase [Pseudonocardiaceae bacterium]